MFKIGDLVKSKEAWMCDGGDGWCCPIGIIVAGHPGRDLERYVKWIHPFGDEDLDSCVIYDLELLNEAVYSP